MDIENKTQEELLKLLIDFIEKYNMEEEPIIEVIKEFSHKYNIDDLFIATELSDYKPFLELAENNLTKHKYLKSENKEENNSNPLELWS